MVNRSNTNIIDTGIQFFVDKKRLNSGIYDASISMSCANSVSA
jgi:hypothetical protein